VNLITVDEAAEWLRCNPVTVRNMIKRGELSACRVGRLIRIDADSLPRPERVEIPPARRPRRSANKYAHTLKERTHG
jgi:excisionase family DNA binding protein